jgi:phosphotriesterase-related protein
MTRRELCLGLAALAPPRSILTHEHILVDFIGADRIDQTRYPREEIVRRAEPRIRAIQQHGCLRMLECTPNYIGRDPQLLRMISQRTGLEIWTNTGLYAAADYKFLPTFAKTESAEQLAQRWIAEWRDGIDGVKPRFIKIGVNKGPLGEWDRKVVQAAVLTSRATGLTIAAHTGDGAAALEELAIVKAGGLASKRFVWVHAQNESDYAIHERMARAGAWVSLDGVNGPGAKRHMAILQHLTERGLIKRILLSQDSGWYRPEEPGGGAWRGYDWIYQNFLPQLPAAQVQQLMWRNPLEAFGK